MLEKWLEIEKKWDRLNDKIDKLCIAIACVAFVGIVVFICGNVLCRFILSKSLNWAEEVAYLCFNWVVFFGVVVIYRHQGLISIDLLVDRLPPKSKRGVLIFGYLLVVLINIGLIVWGTQFSIVAWARKSPSLQIPYFFYDISIPLAAIFLLMYSMKFLIRAIMGENVDAAALEDRS